MFVSMTVSAAVSSIVADGVQLGGTAAGIGSQNKIVGTLLFGTVSGGISSSLTGGNFWEGAGIGLAVSLLNHVAHEIQCPNCGKEFAWKEGDIVQDGNNDYFIHKDGQFVPYTPLGVRMVDFIPVVALPKAIGFLAKLFGRTAKG